MTSSALGWEPLWEQDTPCPALEGLSAALRAQLLQAAADLLWRWTGQLFGFEEVTVRPCRQDRPQRPSTFWGWAPLILPDGTRHPVVCGECASNRCGCENPSALLLPGPVHQVHEVLLDGVPLEPFNFEVTNHRRIQRYDGKPWPTTQRLDLPLGDPDTWGVTYLRGLPLPIGGRLALGKLACELALAYAEDGDCQLPQRLQSITRQGVTMAVLDSFEGLENGRTGIWLIDSWIASVTTPVRATSAVRSPDVPRSR